MTEALIGFAAVLALVLVRMPIAFAISPTSHVRGRGGRFRPRRLPAENP